MVMFVTMYSMIDRDMFSFLPPQRAENEWDRVRHNKEAFLEDTLTQYNSTCETSWIGACRNFYGHIECEQCLFTKKTTQSTTTQATTTNKQLKNETVTQASVGLHQKVAIQSKELFEKSKQWTKSVFSSQLVVTSLSSLILLVTL